MKEIKDDKKKKAFAESEILMRELMTKELKDKLNKKISEDDAQVINAIKSLLSESDDN